MRKLWILFAVLTLQALLLPSPTAKADDVVHFLDPNLRAAVGQAIGKPSGDIYESDLQDLRSLDADSRHIKDLTGVEYCTSLNVLDLAGNEISDIAPLSDLTSLSRLLLAGNHIEDITPLSNLRNLTTLDLSGNEVTDIAPLSGLTSLTWLGLRTNWLINISPLSDLTGLTILHLEENLISDISPLTRLTGITELYLRGNLIADITALENLFNPDYIYLAYNQISDISPLTSISRLGKRDVVDLTENPLSAAALEVHIPELTQRGVVVISNALPTPSPGSENESGLNPGLIIGPVLAALIVVTLVFRMLTRETWETD
jgi:Leucine-rich repeat (LRR) protein